MKKLNDADAIILLNKKLEAWKDYALLLEQLQGSDVDPSEYDYELNEITNRLIVLGEYEDE